jgi:Tol biopolymer transport system component
MLAYRSEANGGGIYLLAVSSGKPRLFAAGGHRPRFSLDGRRVAYWTGAGSTTKLFVRDVARGTAVALHPGFQSAGDPVWSPDGKHILFAGCKDAAAESCDWWVSPADGGEPAATGASTFFQQLHFVGLPSPDLWLSSAKGIVFTAKSGDNTRLWTLQVSPGAWRVAGTPRRLTAAKTDERNATATSEGRIFYASRTENIDVWYLPLDANRAASIGQLT